MSNLLQCAASFLLYFHVLPPFKERLERNRILSAAYLPPSLELIMRDPTYSLVSCLFRELIHLLAISATLKIILYLIGTAETSLDACFHKHIQFCNINLLLKIPSPQSKHSIILCFLSTMVLSIVDQPVSVTAHPSFTAELEGEPLARRYLCHSGIHLLDAFWSKLLGKDLLARPALYGKGRNRIGL